MGEAVKNWGYPDYDHQGSETTPPVQGVATFPSAVHEQVLEKPVRISLVRIFVFLGLSLISALITATILLYPKLDIKVSDMLDLLKGGFNKPVQHNTALGIGAFQVVKEDKALFNCGGTFTDSPGHSDNCVPVASVKLDDDRGRGFITKAWSE